MLGRIPRSYKNPVRGPLIAKGSHLTRQLRQFQFPSQARSRTEKGPNHHAPEPSGVKTLLDVTEKGRNVEGLLLSVIGMWLLFLILAEHQSIRKYA